MAATKIIVVSQKGGVGKSTISVNLAAWFQVIQNRSTILLDYDPHGSSSTWLSDAKEIGVTTQHHPIDEAGGRRWLLTAR
ncbi:MAG: ParA family protein, partial [Burkholderiaceae bacterium]